MRPAFRIWAIGVLCIVLAGPGIARQLPLVSAQDQQQSAATLTAPPAADARVEEANPTWNFGADSTLAVDGGGDPATESFLRFEVTGITAPVQSAILGLYATNATVAGPSLYQTAADWEESEITWETRPPRTGAAVAEVGGFAAETWVEYDVTAVVTADGAYSFVLATTSTDGTNFVSREGDRPPHLVIRMGSVEATTPTPVSPSPTTSDLPIVATPAPASSDEAVLLAAGDIADCRSTADEATADLLDDLPGVVATLGDNVYEYGTPLEFALCYDPSWGRHKDRTRPAAGNHEYDTPGAAGYFGYFGDAAGDPDKGYYSYELGTWHVVVLNSNCEEIGGCDEGSPQEQWLRADLADHPASCTLAYMHHPRFSSGANHGSSTEVEALWEALYDAGAEVVLAAHDHTYERFAPQDPDGNADPVRGIRHFVVGTGGAGLYGFGTPLPNSEVRNGETHGVLMLTLGDGWYAWEFVPVEEQSFTDSGRGTCLPMQVKPSWVAGLFPAASPTAGGE